MLVAGDGPVCMLIQGQKSGARGESPTVVELLFPFEIARDRAFDVEQGRANCISVANLVAHRFKAAVGRRSWRPPLAIWCHFRDGTGRRERYSRSYQVQPIWLLRNTYLIAYMHALREHGVAPEPLLAKHGIVADFELIPDYMVSARLLHGYIIEAVSHGPPGAVSVAAGLFNAAFQPNPFSDTAWKSVTLLEAIRRHNANVTRYSPENRFRFSVAKGEGHWEKQDRSPLAETEIFCVANLIGHVRMSLGDGWSPPSVDVSVAEPSTLASLPLFEGVSVRAVPISATIHIPLSALALPSSSRDAGLSERALPDDFGDLDFVQSMRELIRSYVRVGELSFSNVALAAGLSRRTLQRRLSDVGISYSGMVDQVRFEVARELLLESPELPVTQIGYELGYADPGSFTRAFRRFAGTSPIAFRRASPSGMPTAEVA